MMVESRKRMCEGKKKSGRKDGGVGGLYRRVLLCMTHSDVVAGDVQVTRLCKT